MNERIQELAVQAGIISAEYNGFDATGLTRAQRKFVELIVQECAKVADEKRDTSVGCGYITKTTGQRICEHFGVEQ